VDAGSKDGTLDIIMKYNEQYPGKIIYISEPDNGPGEGWNKGLKMARGDIFGSIGYDDRYMPGAIETVVQFFSDKPEAEFVHGNCDYINVEGEVIYRHRVEDFNYNDFVNTARHISGTSAFYKRAVMEKIGWCDSSGDDFDVMLRITASFRVFAINQVLSQIRLHSSFFRPADFHSQ
jgi:glycosyltransferase involved in cell wall biosynthesis